MHIERQKAIATGLLMGLAPLDPEVIVAGGAPRNWSQGLPAKDLDIYIHFTPRTGIAAISLIRALTGWTCVIKGEEYEDELNGVIRYVLEAVIEGEFKAQFVFITTPVYATLDHFVVDNSKMYFARGQIVSQDKARLANHFKEIWVNKAQAELTPQQVGYVEKISGYYPDWQVVYQPNYDEAIEDYHNGFVPVLEGDF